MPMRLNDVNSDASEAAFGFKATSASLKPVHLSQVVFSNVLGSTHQSQDLFKFVENPENSLQRLGREISRSVRVLPRSQ